MEKRKIIKDDGRYMIFYAFERNHPELHPDQVRDEDSREASQPGPRRSQGGEG